MRVKVAFLATAVNLLLTIILVLVCVSHADAQYTELCRLSATTQDSAAFCEADLIAPLAGFVIAIVCASALVEFCVLALVIRHVNKEARDALNVLDAFCQGEYSERMQPSTGSFAQERERFNALLSQLQDRLKKLHSRNQAVDLVMTRMQNGLIAVDADLRVILVTTVAKELLGIKGNAEGLPIVDASKDVRLDQLFSDAMRHADGIYTNEVAARMPGGRGHRPLSLYVSVMRQEGKVVGALALVEDITKLRMLEQVRTDFAANVSHELKTPLTSIKGFVETLMNGAIEKPEMAQKFLRIIMLEADRLTRVINDILSISKLESGEDSGAKELIRIDEVARNVVEMLELHASEKEVTLHAYDCPPTYVLGHPDRVEQMMINLIENAIKYNKPGGSVSIRIFPNGKEVNISISDTGIGIAEEHLPRLFERFYRVDKGRSRSMGGTGLGLAIVKHIVRSMDGMIEVHSKLGEGTEFLITLPQEADSQSAQAAGGDATQNEGEAEE